jgi:hypothetical protein
MHVVCKNSKKKKKTTREYRVQGETEIKESKGVYKEVI